MPSSPDTVRLHCDICCPAEHLYRAFLDRKARVTWLPPHGFVGEVQRSDVRVGGVNHMSFTNYRTGQAHSFGGTFTELTPGQRIRHTDTFDDPSLSGELCYLGWQESLSLLALLVEPEIPWRGGPDVPRFRLKVRLLRGHGTRLFGLDALEGHCVQQRRLHGHRRQSALGRHAL